MAQSRIASRKQSIRLERSGPFPPGAKTLQSEERLYRVRVGDWRILYQVDFERAIITIANILHRSQAYP
ncbi:MAG: type II toxin-antitoxin system RelE/ParE family toxin [Acidobacteriia bacterium]|nr:type II toxin-antitoxin system RelE/ParE family toxin [Terriglobia bacterium]